MRNRQKYVWPLGVALLVTFLCAGLCAGATPAFAQEVQATPNKTDAPAVDQSQQAGSQNAPDNTQSSSQKDTVTQPAAQGNAGQRGTRVFGVMPNELTVEGATQVTPISAGEKFKLVTEGAFDPYEFVVVGILAGIGQADNDTPEWGQGAKGYGLRYGTNLGDLVVGNYMVGAVFPSLLHQDPRYFQSGKGGFWRRTGYAVSRVLITRGDSGKQQFNYSEIAGNAVAGVISNTYQPPQERSFAEGAQTWATQIAVDAIGFELKEFWPDIRRRFFKKKNPQP